MDNNYLKEPEKNSNNSQIEPAYLENYMRNFSNTMHLIMSQEKKSHNFGTDIEISYAEIHTIQAIGNNPSIHVTGLAEILGVTKGAVSQILMKLEKKGFISKGKSPDNQSRLVLSLTPKGTTAYKNHEIVHKAMFDFMYGVFKDYNKDELDFINNFIKKLEKGIYELNIKRF